MISEKRVDITRAHFEFETFSKYRLQRRSKFRSIKIFQGRDFNEDSFFFNFQNVNDFRE